jgi:hypothetical protein
MQPQILATAVIAFACAANSNAAPPIELELATDRGVQITAPQEWLQLLAGIGVTNVRIRGLQAGDTPVAKNHGTAERPSYRVFGIITSRDLRLPGGTFTLGQRAKLKDYFDRLGADGAESLTAPRGRFGLTEKELSAVLADLSQLIDFETKDQTLRAVLDRLQSKLRLKCVIDADAARAIGKAPPVADDLKNFAAGTGLAMMLRSAGLNFRPEKSRGEVVAYHIAVASPAAIDQSTLGKTEDQELTVWPIGWEPDEAPGAVAPTLLESRPVEIRGYSLEEALAAIAPLAKVPLLFDHAALAARHIHPANIQVELAREQLTYRRMIDRILSPARLGSQIRVDENGKPFLWITK